MKIGFAQINPTVGDLVGNTQKILDIITSNSKKCDIIIFPEMVLTGYPAQDLLFETQFLNLAKNQSDAIVDSIEDCTVILGTIRAENSKLFNTAVVIQNGEIIQYVDKSLLPTYDVFEEDRYFNSAKEIVPVNVEINGENVKLGIHICEDLWNSENDVNVVKTLGEKGADIFINLSASPFSLNRIEDRIEVAKSKVNQFNKPFLYCNLVGGQDELVFDGQSFGLNSKGDLIHISKPYQESFEILDLNHENDVELNLVSEDEQLFNAICIGLKDYFSKTGHKKAVLGLSGGIDSALTCAIAVKALGTENVCGYALPSKFSSNHSVNDAEKLAENLGIHFSIIPIKNVHDQFLDSLSNDMDVKTSSLALENLQARIRGNMLMALANKFGALLLNTSNKTETALGYSTLYGDMCGAIGVISDLNKHQVYSLSKWINNHFGKELIPVNSISKEPSAELKPDQTDPFDYDEISPMVESIITENKHLHQLTRQGYDKDDVQDILRKIRFSEFKRRQASPGIRVSRKAFGMGRKYPIVNQFKG